MNKGKDAAKNSPLPAPDENMKKFDWFLGEWDVQSRILTDAEKDEWLDESIYTQHTLELNGHLIFEHFYGPVGGTPIEAWSLRKYNNQTGRFEQRWIDTSTPPILSWNGSFNDAGEFVGYPMRFLNDDYQIAGDDARRETFFNIQADRFSWRYDATSDGGKTWTTQWTLEYTRRNGASF